MCPYEWCPQSSTEQWGKLGIWWNRFATISRNIRMICCLNMFKDNISQHFFKILLYRAYALYKTLIYDSFCTSDMPFEVRGSAHPLHADPLQSQEAAETYWWGRWRASWRAPAASPSCCNLGEQIMGIDKWHFHHAAWHAIERNRTEKAHITSYHGYWPKLISYPSDCRRRRVVEPRSRYVQIFSVAW